MNRKICYALTSTLLVTCAFAETGADGRARPLPVSGKQLGELHVTTGGRIIRNTAAGIDNGAVVNGGACIQTESYTDADFTGDSFNAQGGFGEGEIAAVSYALSPNDFPIKIELIEAIFATQNAAVQTTTEWSVLVWDGPPNTGTLVASFSSDGSIIPHVIIGPGDAGSNVMVSVDPGDPEQIFVNNISGTNTFSVGYRIDRHNAQSGNPCTTAPPSQFNAFPTTDLSGLSEPTQNWLFGLNCGPLGCPPNGGWSTFQGLLPILCRPTGDWVIRATWSSVSCQPGLGACCLPSGECQVGLSSGCAADGGTFQGDGSACQDVTCPEPVGACCFPATGGCVDTLSESNCSGAAGLFQGGGSDCGQIVCFPMGACCLPDGTCSGPISPEECGTMGGSFQGDSTECGTVECPLPQGACCFPNEFCLDLTEVDCGKAGAVWRGAGTVCDASICAAPPCGPCADSNCDGSVSVGDINFFVAAVTGGQPAWDAAHGGNPPCDYLCANDANNDESVSVGDINAFVAAVTGPAGCD